MVEFFKKRRLEVDNPEPDNDDGNVVYRSNLRPGMIVTLKSHPEFRGKITSISFWEHGCVRAGVRPLQLKDGLPQESIYMDEPDVIPIEEEENKTVTKRHGDRTEPRMI